MDTLVGRETFPEKVAKGKFASSSSRLTLCEMNVRSLATKYNIKHIPQSFTFEWKCQVYGESILQMLTF